MFCVYHYYYYCYYAIVFVHDDVLCYYAIVFVCNYVLGVHVYMCMCVCVYVCMCVCVYVCIYIYIYIYICRRLFCTAPLEGRNPTTEKSVKITSLMTSGEIIDARRHY